MSFFSEINGYNEKAIKSFEIKNVERDEFSEVDFCKENDLYSEPKTSFLAGDKEILEEFMYNYEITESEARDYIEKNIDTEG